MAALSLFEPFVAMEPDPVSASPNCAAYDGTTVIFDDLEPVINKLSAVKKGEFETTEEFTSRLNTARTNLKARYVVKTRMEDPKIQYVADNSMAIVSMENLGYDLGGVTAWYVGQMTGKWKLQKIQSFTLNKKTTITGSYSGTSVFGFPVKVTRELETASYFIDTSQIDIKTPWGVKFTPVEASNLLPKVRSAIVVSLSGAIGDTSERSVDPKVNMPFDVTYRTRFISGRFLCGLLYLPGGKVVATFESSDRFAD